VGGLALQVDFNQDGRMSTATDLITGMKMTLDQVMMEYFTAESGAYLFTPLGSAQPLLQGCPTTRVAKGLLVTSVEQYFPETVRQTVRVYSGNQVTPQNRAIEIVVNVDGALSPNRELIMRFNSDIQNSGRYYTDNGLEMVVRDFDTSWPDKIASNYRPIISSITVNDAQAYLTLISSQAHGVASLAQGQLEVMIQRRTMQDDGLGMEEAMDETAPCQASFDVIFQATLKDTALLRHHLALTRNNPLTILHTDLPQNAAEWAANHYLSFSPLAQPFPPNVHLLTFQRRNGISSSVAMRLVHLYEVEEHPELSQDATVDLGAIFSDRNLDDLDERTLSLRDPVSVVHSPYRWSSTAHPHEKASENFADSRAPNAQLRPVQIRTYLTDFREK